MKGVTLTASQAALEFGLQAPQVQAKLERAGEPIGRGTKYQLRTLLKILRPSDGGLRAAKTRETELRADHLERQIAAQDENLISAERVREFVAEKLMPMRQRLLSMSESLAARCNPSDPTHAKLALAEWVKDTMVGYCDEIESNRAPAKKRRTKKSEGCERGEPGAVEKAADRRNAARANRAASRPASASRGRAGGRVGKTKHLDTGKSKPKPRPVSA